MAIVLSYGIEQISLFITSFILTDFGYLNKTL